MKITIGKFVITFGPPHACQVCGRRFPVFQWDGVRWACWWHREDS